MSSLSNVSNVDLLKEVLDRISTSKIGFKQVMEKPDIKELEKYHVKYHVDIRKGHKLIPNTFLNHKVYYPNGFSSFNIDSDKLYKIWFRESEASDTADLSKTLWIYYIEEQTDEIELLEAIRIFLKWKK